MGSKSSAPATPDYTGAAKATAAGNLQAAQEATVANRPNMMTPWGNSTWSQGQSLDQNAYNAAMQKYNAGSTQATPGSYTQGWTAGGNDSGMQPTQTWNPGTAGTTQGAMPNQADYMTGNGQWSNNVSLSPSQQALFDQSNNLQTGLFNSQNSALDRVSSTMSQPCDTSGLPAAGSVLDPNSLKYGDVLDINGLPKSGTAFNPTGQTLAQYDPNGSTNTATQAIMSRVNPQLNMQEESLRTRLANEGVNPGSEAWNNEMRQFGQQKNDAVTQAGLQGINLGMQQSQTGFGQGLQNRNLVSSEQAQGFNQQNSLQSLAAALQQQRYGQQSNNNSQYMQAQNQGFGQSTTNRNNALGLAQYQRGLPMNELNALRTGNQVSAPTFQNYSQQATTGGADLTGAMNQTYQSQLGNANAQNAANSSMMNGLFSRGSAGMGMYGMMNKPVGMFG